VLRLFYPSFRPRARLHSRLHSPRPTDGRHLCLSSKRTRWFSFRSHGMDAVQRSLFRAVMREGRRFDHQFRMPAIQELWGSGVYQQQKTHEKGLQRLLPQELRPLVGGGGPVVLGREELCSRRSSNPSPNSSVSSPSTPGRPARLFRRKDVLKWIMEEEVGLGPFEVLKYFYLFYIYSCL